jgi:hypothetical protein
VTSQALATSMIQRSRAENVTVRSFG